MKPFDLDAAKRGDKMRTRNGNDAYFAGFNYDHSFTYCVEVRVTQNIGCGYGLYHYTKSGNFFVDCENELDLFMVEDEDHPLKGEKS